MPLPSGFKLIDNGWKEHFSDSSLLKTDELMIVSPFIKEQTAKRLVNGKKHIRVLTRFSLRDFAEGVSDTSALRHFLDVGAEVRGIRNLHAKMYVFGALRAIVTSANLTDAALTRNHELGFSTENGEIIATCRDYFERLWNRASDGILNDALLTKWEGEVQKASAAASAMPSATKGLRDYGANLGFMPDSPPPTVEQTITTQAFIKFFGEGSNRAPLTMPIFQEVEESESHWGLSYPGTKRPRQVSTGDIMFIGRMVAPDDLRVYGRAIAYEHVPGRDDASPADIERRDWKEDWSTYIRVREPEFIAGTLANGISRNEMMETLGAETFVSTSENNAAGNGNTSPRIALMSKAHMRLTQTAADWLNGKFHQAIAKHGRIPLSQLETLYWPPLP